MPTWPGLGVRIACRSEPRNEPTTTDHERRRDKEAAMARIDEIVDGIYRISTTYSDGFDFQCNQFLIDDECPAPARTRTPATAAPRSGCLSALGRDACGSSATGVCRGQR